MFRLSPLGAMLVAAVVSVAQAAEKPNVVIVLVDDFGWGDPSCYGNTMVKTPNMDRLAKEGVRFTQGYVTAPLCSPSRCSMITGQFPARWKITSYLQTKAGNQACEMADFLDPKAPSLPRILKEAGYATAHIGKWHLGGGRDVTEAPKFAAYGYDLGLGTYESPEPAAPLGLKTLPWGPQDKLEPQQVPRHERSKWMVDETLAFLKKNSGKPCFVNLWLDDTHTPFVPSEAQMKAVRVEGEAEQKTKYKAVLVDLDRQIGRLLDGLKGTNTLVLFLGDNGASPPFERERNGGLRGQKLSLYEGGIRVPFVTWWPEQVKGGVVNDKTVIAALDFLPTLANVCGAKLPKDYAADGEDMTAALRGESPVRTKPLFWEYGRNATAFAYPRDPKDRSPNVAVRDGNWKLLVNADGTGAELYDLSKDAKEARNVSADHAEVSKRLTEKALVWRKAVPKRATTVALDGDKFLINGQPTYKGRKWNGTSIEGLLLNSRMVQATFDDRNPDTRGKWAYPDTRKWDADRNTREFIEQMPTWRKHGLLAMTLNLQGGSPEGYSKSQPWHNSAVNADGTLDDKYLARLTKVLDGADELGLVVILGIYYFGQDQHVKDEAAVSAGVDATVDWLVEKRYTNVVIEINNECNVNAYDHDILKPDRVHELIERAQKRSADKKHRLLVGTSYGGNTVPKSNVVKASDFLLLHGNGVKEPKRIGELVRETRKVEGYRPMPILFNEDDHFDFDKPSNNFAAAVGEFASWGYFDYRMKGEGFDEGYQSVPVNWKTSSERKKGFFKLLSDITGERP